MDATTTISVTTTAASAITTTAATVSLSSAVISATTITTTTATATPTATTSAAAAPATPSTHLSTAATLLAAATNIAKICNNNTNSNNNNINNSSSAASSNSANNNNNNNNNSSVLVLPSSTSQLQQQLQSQSQSQILGIDSVALGGGVGRLDDVNNLSIASSMSEGQRSRCALSGAPSASSSPILSPPTKIFGRNANGTVVATARPNNEAETQLYRVLQRASLLSYFDTLVEMGGDDVQQLYEAGEEEFLEIMSLVGMASKPLHVRRLQKALHQWSQNPGLFQGPVIYNASTGLCDTPTKSSAIFIAEPSPTLPRNKYQTFSPTPAANIPFNPTPLLTTTQTQSSSPSHFLAQMCTPALTVPVIQQQPTAISLATASSLNAQTMANASGGGGNGGCGGSNSSSIGTTAAGSTSHQVSSSSPQLTPVLSEKQVLHITIGAEKIARQLPAREPRPQTSKKRTSRELEQIIAMSENDPRRMEEIRKYSAIYGRFDCKRRPEKPLTMHEVCVNEAAAQLCRLVPALLTRRDELFPLARQIVKDAGFGHSATIARYGGLLPQIQSSTSTSASSTQRINVLVDCESSDSAATGTSINMKRQRLLSNENPNTPDLSRDSAEDSRYNLFAMYQKFAAKQPFDLADMSKFSFQHKPDMEDNDSRFSFSNSNSPSQHAQNGMETDREINEALSANSLRTPEVHSTANSESSSTNQRMLSPTHLRFPTTMSSNTSGEYCHETTTQMNMNQNALSGVHVISAAAAGHIIAVANPALAMSPTLNEALSMKRETDSSEL